MLIRKSLKSKKWFIVLIVILLLIIFFGLFLLFYRNGVLLAPAGNEVCFENNCFSVEIADTDNSRATGLMFRESLDENSGMLFIFETEIDHVFWMKNTLITLDIIWINSSGEIVAIAENQQPCNENETCFGINPKADALYVLELNAGAVQEFGIEVGDFVEISLSP